MHRHVAAAAVLVSLVLGVAVRAQLANPIPAPVTKQGLRVEIKDVARLPDSRGLRPAAEDVAPTSWARVNFVRELPDGRRFANDMRGLLYMLDAKGQPTLYVDVAAVFPQGWYRGLQNGLVNFEFHPEFAKNGLFYTVHTERGPGNPGKPDFIPPGFAPDEVTYQTVVTEWHASNPSAATFTGTRREMLRVGHIVNNLFHPIGDLQFNPLSKPGAPDYGLMYIGGGDWGFSNGGGPKGYNFAQTQRLDTLLGAILRIDPRSPRVSGGTKGIGDYTIPPINKFAADGDPRTFGEIFAYGFRNAHRLSWDPTDGTMFASDIGNSNIEEINIIREGGNYGWMRREGIFENGLHVPGGNGNQVYDLPEDILSGKTKDGFVYPVAMYDHGEGLSITAGYPYYGRVAALRGKFVFGDIARGRVFAADIAALKAADDAIPRTVAPIQEIQLFVRDASGKPADVTLQELGEKLMGKLARADLQISRARDGELYVTTRQDGMIRTFVPDSSAATR